MKIEESVFEKKKIVPEKAKAFGFAPDGDGLFYSRDFFGGDFRAEIRIRPDGGISGSVTDKMNDDEYAPLRAEGMQGAYVSSVRAAYTEILCEIAAACCFDVLFASDQANRIAKAVKERYGVSPDFPFDDGKDRTAGVFRHTDTGKWFGLIMRVKKSVLAGESEADRIDVMNLKAEPKAIPELWKTAGVYPAYHMNRTYWISVALDDRLTDGAVMELIAESFRLTKK